MQPIKADDLLTAWSRGQFKPAYLFTGSEDFLIEECCKRLLAQKLPAADTINYDRLDAEDISAGEILQVVQTMPFGADTRLVEVRNVGRLSSEAQKELAAGLANLPPSTQLTLIWGKEWRRDDAERPLVKAMMQIGSVVIFWPMFPENAQRWLMQRAKHYQKTISAEAASWLVKETGEGLRRLDQELAKAAGYVGERPEITREDLEVCFGYQKEQSPFEWLGAVRGKRYAPAMKTLKQLLDEDEEPLKLLALATSSVREWIETKEKGAAPATFRRPGGRGADEGAVIRDLERRPMEELLEGLSSCVEAHQTIKSGKETPEMALTLLTLRLCGLQTLDASR